nr:hypothetical protein [Tanacetum cinerariifolium]
MFVVTSTSKLSEIHRRQYDRHNFNVGVMKEATLIGMSCQIDSTGGRTILVLSKEKEKEKDKSKAPGVVDHLLEILMKYPSLNPEENCTRSDNAMEIDNSFANKGLAKLTFVLKLLSDILLMYVHAVGIILRRAANAVEQLALSYLANKKKSISLVTTSGNQMVTTTVNQIQEGTSNNNQHEITSTGDAGQLINAFPHLF